jgi:hypothetical protein
MAIVDLPLRILNILSNNLLYLELMYYIYFILYYILYLEYNCMYSVYHVYIVHLAARIKVMMLRKRIYLENMILFHI